VSQRKTVGRNIRKVRIEKSWTQEKLATRSKLTYEYINRLENGRVNVSLDTLVRIAKALKIEPHLLLIPESYKTE
jgi:transcriptional regulator with XRE-family HTH domain